MTPEAFWDRTKRMPNGCIEWRGAALPNGYGHARLPGVASTLAHRIAWLLTNGPIPDGMFVCHNCPDGDNPKCVNVAHLWLGTPKDNTHDMIRKGHHQRFLGESNASARLTVPDVRAILALKGTGISALSASAMFDTSQSNVQRIWAREIWKHVEEPRCDVVTRRAA